MTDDAKGGPRTLRPILTASLARVLSLVPTAAATLLTSRLLFEHYDTRVFNGYTLVLSTMLLLPVNTLGVGVAVTSVFAAPGPSSELAHRTALTATRVLLLSAVVVACVSLGLSAAGAWPELLGSGATTGFAFGGALAIYGVTFVPALGQNMLLGVSRTAVSIGVMALWAPLSLVAVVVVIQLDASPSWVLVVPAITLAAVTMLVAWISGRITNFSWRRMLSQVLDRTRHPGAPVRALAGPSLILSLASPILLHSDRLVLSHVSSGLELARYSVVWQIFAPLAAVTVAAAQPLWPLYTKARASGTRPPSLMLFLPLFAGGTALGAAALCLVSDAVAGLISEDSVELGVALPVTMALFVVVTSLVFTLAMSIMDPAGLRLAARLCLLALPLNLGLSILLADHLGAPGPLLATATVTLLVQFVPAAVHVRRRSSRGLPPGDSDQGGTIPLDMAPHLPGETGLG